MLLDSLAQRYGVLPSKVLADGDVIDLLAAIWSVEYQEHVKKTKAKGQVPTRFTQDQLLQQIQSVRARDETGRTG